MSQPFLQRYVFVTESGAVYDVRALGHDYDHGEGVARSMLTDVDESQLWDVCEAPVCDDVTRRGECVLTLKPSEA